MSTKYFAVFMQGWQEPAWPPVRRFPTLNGEVAVLLLGRLYVRLGRLL